MVVLKQNGTSTLQPPVAFFRVSRSSLGTIVRAILLPPWTEILVDAGGRKREMLFGIMNVGSR